MGSNQGEEPLLRFQAVPNSGLDRVQGEAVAFHPGAHFRQGRFRFFSRPAHDHKIVSVPNHPVAFRGHQLVQRMQVDVRQQRADDRALRRATSEVLADGMGDLFDETLAADIWFFAMNIETGSAKDLPLRQQLTRAALRAKGIILETSVGHVLIARKPHG